MTVSTDNTSPVISRASSPTFGDHGKDFDNNKIIPISIEAPTSSAAAVGAKTAIEPEGRSPLLQRICYLVKIIAAIALFVVGIAALVCLYLGSVISTPSLILMLAIMLVSFVIVITAIRDGTPSQVVRHMKQQIQQFGEENTRLHTAVENLKAVNVELSEQINQLKQLHTRLSDFGDRLEANTGDFTALIADFQLSLEEFKSVGTKVETMLSPFEKLAQSLKETFSQEAVQAMMSSVTELRTNLNALKELITENKTVIEQLKADAQLREEQVRFLEKRKQELEEACSTLSHSIATLQESTTLLKDSTTNLHAVESRLIGVMVQDGAESSTVEEASQDDSAQPQDENQSDAGEHKDS
ncbi:inclusion membrane protein IncA [Chlamydia caviae]|uniref:Inclusion membrane protein A n=2 Tax=Chlamydia caviae TaxID=83557 RepID=INCA_CHLCV|nr:inclusion membrane protein IncA [Chlamydia caviae]H2VFV1.1 RecName: Full=Inclusion membrane protein A [Chlamydia caviae GPIC]pir/S61491/ inclusion membrane protein A - Chlamydophila psittaci [Chlamydia psittaci]AAC41443.1 inclusion membrane localised protein [Chlamydia caviae]AAP05293.1 inclusion membrane protein A [Chlamydia caviae GPIC]prf//2108371A inclusion membrane protein [Chlamydia psittaci]